MTREIGARSTEASGSTLTVGIGLAVLWALHAAANYLPGTGYLRLPILFAMAAACLAWRSSGDGSGSHRVHQSVTTIGLCCLLIAATLSTILNWNTEEVVSTYVFVFVSGAAVFVALSGVSCTPAALDIATAGLAVGTLFPVLGGLVAFYGEWGAPEVTTTIAAWQSLARMNTYMAATFGNRGNTAGFLLIVTPMLLAVLLDGRKSLALRAICIAVLAPIGLNLIVLQVRAAYIALFAAFVAVWVFKLGRRRLPLLVGMSIVAWILLFRFLPDAGLMMTDRIVPAITIDTEGDQSVEGRVAAMKEGVVIARRNWLLGIGPGGALTIHSQGSAHQFQLQQGMETGILGFAGSILLSIGLLVSLARTMARGGGDEVNDMRFMLLIGPASYLTYASIANAALANGSLNTWTVLLASMLALAPQFEPAVAGRRAQAARWSLPQLAGAAGGIGRVGALLPVAGRSDRWRA